jgi:hypothetical protein
MPYRVSYDEENAIILVTFSSPAVKEDHYAALEAALQLCREPGCSKLLVDFCNLVTSNLSTMESFAIAETIARAAPHLMIAHVLPQNAKALENVRFASDVEANRGKSTGEFETVEQARNWLASLK